jgi:hypothetical protein
MSGRKFVQSAGQITEAEIQERARIAGNIVNEEDICGVAGPFLGRICDDLAKEASSSPFAILTIFVSIIGAILGPTVKLRVSPLHNWETASRMWTVILAGKHNLIIICFCYLKNIPLVILYSVLTPPALF